MLKFYPLKGLKNLKGKHKIDTLAPFGHEIWRGEIDDGKYYIIVGCLNKTIKIKIAETEIDVLHFTKTINIAKINKLYAGLGYLTEPPKQCEIKLVLDLLEWKYNDDDIWC